MHRIAPAAARGVDEGCAAYKKNAFAFARFYLRLTVTLVDTEHATFYLLLPATAPGFAYKPYKEHSHAARLNRILLRH